MEWNVTDAIMCLLRNESVYQEIFLDVATTTTAAVVITAAVFIFCCCCCCLWHNYQSLYCFITFSSFTVCIDWASLMCSTMAYPHNWISFIIANGLNKYLNILSSPVAIVIIASFQRTATLLFDDINVKEQIRCLSAINLLKMWRIVKQFDQICWDLVSLCAQSNFFFFAFDNNHFHDEASKGWLQS